jgi:nucleoside-diphosphate-sugar epimerase
VSALRILVTGAGGFVGQTVVQRLLAHERFGGALLTLVDRQVRCSRTDTKAIEGDLSRADVLREAMATQPDIIFHLAAVPGGAAEADPQLSRRVNLETTMNLIEAAAALPQPPRFVYSSSIAVFGVPLPDHVDDATPTKPTLIYGAHKLMAEIALADAVRRSALEAVALRLPGIVARAPSAEGFRSAFLSDLFWALRDSRPIDIPVRPDATTWLMSARCCADNLIHAALTRVGPADPVAMTLPALRVTVGELVGAVAKAVSSHASLVRYAPDPELEAQFASYPPLTAAAAERRGFCHDGDLRALVADVFAEQAQALEPEEQQ